MKRIKDLIKSISHCNRIHIGDKVIFLFENYFITDMIRCGDEVFAYKLESEKEYYIESTHREEKQKFILSRSLFRRKLCLHNIYNALFYEYITNK